MTTLTADAWVLALAAGMALLVAHTTFSLALRVSTVRSRCGALTVVLSSLALGFGLWATNFVQVLSLWVSERPSIGISWFVLPFAVAASSQACALLFLAYREPDTPGITGGASCGPMTAAAAMTSWPMPKLP
jgi:NO-binding membrane sensor protein with MHYT domain